MKKIPIFEKFGEISPKKIEDSINNRNYVMINYDSDSAKVLSGPRLIEPYVYGYKDTKDGQKYYLRGYIIGDTAKDYHLKDVPSVLRTRSVSLSDSSRNPSGWRLFLVDRISSFAPLGKKFSKYRKGYNDSGDKHIPNIIAQLSKTDFPKGETD